MAEHILVPLIPGAKHHQLDVIITQIIHHALNQIQPLLVRQTGDDANHHLLVILHQPQLLLKCAFILNLLFSEIPGVVILDNAAVRLRVKLLIVNPVDNSPQAVRPCPHQSVQAFPVERHLNLFRIGIAHRGDGIGKDNPAL